MSNESISVQFLIQDLKTVRFSAKSKQNWHNSGYLKLRSSTMKSRLYICLSLLSSSDLWRSIIFNVTFSFRWNICQAYKISLYQGRIFKYFVIKLPNFRIGSFYFCNNLLSRHKMVASGRLMDNSLDNNLLSLERTVLETKNIFTYNFL